MGARRYESVDIRADTFHRSLSNLTILSLILQKCWERNQRKEALKFESCGVKLPTVRPGRILYNGIPYWL